MKGSIKPDETLRQRIISIAVFLISSFINYRIHINDKSKILPLCENQEGLSAYRTGKSIGDLVLVLQQYQGYRQIDQEHLSNDKVHTEI